MLLPFSKKIFKLVAWNRFSSYCRKVPHLQCQSFWHDLFELVPVISIFFSNFHNYTQADVYEISWTQKWNTKYPKMPLQTLKTNLGKTSERSTHRCYPFNFSSDFSNYFHWLNLINTKVGVEKTIASMTSAKHYVRFSGPFLKHLHITIVSFCGNS